nr:unnamed protein product [Callosobruchus analis]
MQNTTVEQKNVPTNIVKLAKIARDEAPAKSYLTQVKKDPVAAKSSKIKAPATYSKEHASTSQQSEWQTVNRRKPQKPRQSLVVGNKDCDKIKGVPKYVDLHVSKISPETSKEDLYQLLKEEFPEIKCETLNSKNPVETGVKSNSVDNFYIEGYYLATFYCRPHKHCGGVAIWVKSFIISEPVNLNHFCIEQSFEVCAFFICKLWIKQIYHFELLPFTFS